VVDTTDTPHNFSALDFLDMEGDCKEGSSPPVIKNDDDSKITQLFTILSQQITQLSTQNMAIQDQLRENENMLLTRFQTVVQDNETFQQSLRSEMDELRHLISSQTQPTCPPRPVPQASHTYAATNSTISDSNGASNQSSPTIPTMVVSPSALISTDPQANMLLLLAESFTKLTSALNEKGNSKSDWPKFPGDQKKFRSWYLSVLSQISIPPWKELYDTSRNDIVMSTYNVSLDEKIICEASYFLGRSSFTRQYHPSALAC